MNLRSKWVIGAFLFAAACPAIARAQAGASSAETGVAVTHAPPPSSTPSGNTATAPFVRYYHCLSNDRVLAITFDGARHTATVASIRYPDITLNEQPALQGFVYRNNNYELTGTASEVRFGVRGARPMRCPSGH